MDPFTAQFKSAGKGDFIKDLTPQKRSLGYVLEVNKETNMMRVRFPKISRDAWIVWGNHGHYRLLQSSALFTL